MLNVETMINIFYLLSTYACLHHFIYDRSASIKCTYWFIMKKLTSSHYKVTTDRIFFPTLKMVLDAFFMQIFINQYICTMNYLIKAICTLFVQRSSNDKNYNLHEKKGMVYIRHIIHAWLSNRSPLVLKSPKDVKSD